MHAQTANLTTVITSRGGKTLGWNMVSWPGLRAEFRPLMRLAAPLVAGELGWMTMGLVDTMMVGRIGKESLGAVSIGSVMFYAITVFGIGILLGLDTLVSQAFGARDLAECHLSFVSGLWAAVLLTPPLMILVYLSSPFLISFGVQPAVMAEATPYLSAIVWSLPTLLAYTAIRRYLQSMNIVKPVMFSLLTANIINAAVNWVLIFGNLGFPALGAAGAGWATTISRFYMLGFLAAYMLWHARREGTGLTHTNPALDWERLAKLTRLGLPAALQITVEVGLFAVAAAFIGRLPAEQLAAHQVALNAASYTFMVPLGLGSAAAVRVGQAVGRRDLPGASAAGWAAILLGGLFMSCAGAIFAGIPAAIGRLFTSDAAVVAAAVSLLRIAAIFQLFDGLQGVATGALRGLGDTRTAMLTHLVCYWLLGLPLGYWLCFTEGWGAFGMWIGFCAALVAIGAILAAMWRLRLRSHATGS
jgi:MATE family multidrug resistance protein